MQFAFWETPLYIILNTNVIFYWTTDICNIKIKNEINKIHAILFFAMFLY